MSKVILKFDGNLSEAESNLEKAMTSIQEKRESSRFKDLYLIDLKDKVDSVFKIALGHMMVEIMRELEEE